MNYHFIDELIEPNGLCWIWVKPAKTFGKVML
jgi:hypothetical protein